MERRLTAHVAAPTADVWRLFVDVERWPELTESMREVRRLDSGPLRVGSEAMIKQPGLARARWMVTELEPGRSFTWESAAIGVTTVGGHLVEPDEDGSTVSLYLRQTGWLAGIVERLVGARATRYMSMELEGFRRGATKRTS
jgi:uncharacterized membrane protein